jgi:hypothetical protein
MQYTFATLAALAAASIVSAQTSAGSPPPGCSTTYSGTFEITVSLPTKKRDIEVVSPGNTHLRRQETDRRQRQTTCSSGALVATLSNSVLTDAKGRIGGVVANHQIQFDGPPSQAGTIYNSGWSVCSNGSLALGPSAIFYQCLSGTFYNLYNTPAGASCEAVIITVIPCGSSGGASQGSDGQPTVTSAVTQATEGQIQASSAASAPPKVTQITDGQVQASSAVAPVSQFTDGQIQVTGSPVQVTPVTQISDGQVQATSAAGAVTQISDGQVQATSAAGAVSQTSDGQIQVSATATATATAAPVTQISDGQIQATASSTAAGAPVSQATEGQVQVTANATKASSTPTPSASQFTGLAPAMTAGAQAVLAMAGFIAVAIL